MNYLTEIGMWTVENGGPAIGIVVFMIFLAAILPSCGLKKTALLVLVGAIGFGWTNSLVPGTVQKAMHEIERIEQVDADYPPLVAFKKSIGKHDFDIAVHYAPYLRHEATDRDVILLGALNNQLNTPLANVSVLVGQRYVSRHEFNEGLHQIRLRANELNPDALASLNALALNDLSGQ